MHKTSKEKEKEKVSQGCAQEPSHLQHSPAFQATQLQRPMEKHSTSQLVSASQSPGAPHTHPQ